MRASSRPPLASPLVSTQSRVSGCSRIAASVSARSSPALRNAAARVNALPLPDSSRSLLQSPPQRLRRARFWAALASIRSISSGGASGMSGGLPGASRGARGWAAGLAGSPFSAGPATSSNHFRRASGTGRNSVGVPSRCSSVTAKYRNPQYNSIAGGWSLPFCLNCLASLGLSIGARVATSAFVARKNIFAPLPDGLTSV